MISIINHTVRFLFTALFVIINSFLKKRHHLIHHSFSKKLLIKETKLALYWIILGVIPLGLALLYIQVLPSDIRKYFSSFLITAAAAVFISMIISVIENCIFYGCKFLCWKQSWLDLTLTQPEPTFWPQETMEFLKQNFHFQ